MAGQSSNTVRFLLGDEERQIADLPPTTTVLNYLRKHERLTGTKEGCAEGDCGACTVVLSEPDGEGGVRIWPVNSCIQFVPMLHGRQLLTVEHLKGVDGTLHPVQQALVDHHASQCGFCTPGFVMQIFSAWKIGAVPEQSSLNDWLAGNLCRCTGYGPILAAAEDVLAGDDGNTDGRAAGEADLADRLAALGGGASLAVESGDQSWFAPRSVEGLAEIYAAHPDAVLVGGATDVGLWVTKAHRTLHTLIDVTRIAALQQIEDTADRLDIGAAVSLTEAHLALGNIHHDIDGMLRRFASTQIRSSGTVGGNIAN
ncbi:MAG: FAD binding domain-containing protein, partial [Alphaproteobacteria bacterium]